MIGRQVSFKEIDDWDAAYNNVNHIPGGADYPNQWQQSAQAYRSSIECELDIAYGKSPREVFDLFLPQNKPAGLFVFVHGGYWMRFDKSYWSHCAKGFVDAGWAVAIPSYSLCPEVSIATIERQIAAAILAASNRIAGPIILSGHSAGGQLVSSLMCQNSPLVASVLERVSQLLSISGVHDLRPLLNTELNQTLRLDMDSAVLASPALKPPVHHVHLTAMVGAGERPEFLRQNALLANIWLGLGASVRSMEITGKHHYDVIDHLLDDNALISSLIGNA